MTAKEAANKLQVMCNWFLANYLDYADTREAFDMAIKALEQSEIIHCKDCKNSEHWYRDRRRCFLWSDDGVSVFDDGFCNYVERRTDERSDQQTGGNRYT